MPLRLNVPALPRLPSFQLSFFQIPPGYGFSQSLQLLVWQLRLSGTTRLRLRSFQIPIFRNTVSAAQLLQPVLVIQQRFPATVARTPIFRTPDAHTPKSSVLFPFLRPLPPFVRLQPTCIVPIHKRDVHFQLFAAQLSAARVDVAASD